jgi:hypothetical protein
VVGKRSIFARRMISDDGSGDVGLVGLQYRVAHGLDRFVGRDRNGPDKSGPLWASVLVIGALYAFVWIENSESLRPSVWVVGQRGEARRRLLVVEVGGVKISKWFGSGDEALAYLNYSSNIRDVLRV